MPNPYRTTPHTRDTLERGLRLSLALLLHWRYTHTQRTGTHSRYVEEGSYEHDLGYCKAKNSAKHPAARGIVDGLVDHEGKVSAAFIASAEK